MIQTDAIETAILSRFGLVPQAGWCDALNRAAVDMARETRCDPGALLSRALRDVGLLKQLVGRLTVPESYFFRHEEQLTVIAGFVRERLGGAEAEAPVRVWSAGCSRGEESFSLAILLKETVPPWALGRIQVYGNDINGEIVLAAKEGVYSEWHFRGLSDSRRRMYFTDLGGGLYQLNSNIRALVSFVHCSIQEQLGRTGAETVDVLLFRNVGIYLSKQCLEALYRGFYCALRPGGVLCVAPSDPPPPSHRGLEKVETGFGVVYRKRAADRGDVFSVPRAGGGPFAVSDGIIGEPVIRCDRPALETREQGAPAGRTPPPPPMSAAVLEEARGGRGWLFEGQVALDARDPESAETIFRRAVFLNPGDPVARFWYALSLFEVKAFNRARAQLNALIASLGEIRASELLPGGESTAGELVESARSLLAKMEMPDGD